MECWHSYHVLVTYVMIMHVDAQEKKLYHPVGLMDQGWGGRSQGVE